MVYIEKNKSRGNTLGEDINVAAVIEDKITNNLYFYKKNIFDKLKDYRTKTGAERVDLVDLCSYFEIGVEIINLNKDDGLIGSCAMNRDKEAFIFVDKKESKESLRNVVAHELAYYLLVKESNALSKRFSSNIIFDKYKKDMGTTNPNINKTCNEFAKEVLMPRTEDLNLLF